MGLLDALLGNNSGGLLSSLLYPTSAPDADAEKKKQDAAFLSAINQDPYNGTSNPSATPTFQPYGGFPNSAPALAGTNSGAYGGSIPFGLGGINLPAAQQGAPASGVFPAIPPMPQMAGAPQAGPQTAPPTVAPQAPQNGPVNNMNIGGYQMPQFGTQAQYTPQTPTDVSAQSRQSQTPQQMPPALGGGSSILGRLFTQDSLLGRLTGNDTRTITQQNLKSQYDALVPALIESGKTPQQAQSLALLAVMNPEAAKTIIPETLTNKEEFKTIKDGFGGERPAFVNPVQQTINGKTIDEYNKGGGGVGGQEVFDGIAKARDAGATPSQLYQMVPATLRSGVQAMIEGKAVPTYLSARGDARNQALMLAHTIDPTFDEAKIGSRLQGNKDFYGGGKSAETMRKTNQSALHFGELVDKMQTLPGTVMPAANAVGNFVNSQLLGKGNAGNFVTNAHALADELSSMFKGAGISDTEIRAWESNLSPNMSDEQQRGMAKTLLGLYRDSVSALEKKRQESIGPVVSAQKGPILGPEAEAALQKVEGFANGKTTGNTTKSGVSWSIVK